MGELFHHIGGHQYFVCRGVLLGRWDALTGEPDEDWEAHREVTVQSVQALKAWLESVQRQVREWLERAEETVLSRLRPDPPWFEGMRGWLQLHHAYQDELHHRGQLYAVARVLGKTPPEVFAEAYPSYWQPRKGT